MALDAGLIVPLAVAAVLFIILGAFLIGVLKRILENVVIGFIALIVANFVGSYVQFTLPINLVTIGLTAILGIAGVGLAIILKLLGFL